MQKDGMQIAEGGGGGSAAIFLSKSLVEFIQIVLFQKPSLDVVTGTLKDKIQNTNYIWDLILL
jgi:hypothetical protein